MLPDFDNLSPDLEWMLQSGQVDEGTLIEALVTRYYQTIYDQALSMLKYPEEAHQAAREVFTQAVMHSSTYRGDLKISSWLEEILETVCQEKFSTIHEGEISGDNLSQVTRMRGAYQLITEEQIEAAEKDIKSQVSKNKTAHSKRVVLQILGVAAAVILLVAILIFTGSSWFPATEQEVTPAPIKPTVKPTEPKISTLQDDVRLPIAEDPLDMQSSSEEIRLRIQSSTRYWNTMWADIAVSFYGPQSYTGPPYIIRHQFWIDPDRGGMLVSGEMNEFPDFIDRFIINSQYDQSFQEWDNSEAYRQIGSSWPWYTINLETMFRFPYLVNYINQLNSRGLGQDLTYTPVGEREYAGHPALTVDLVAEDGNPLGQVYLDPETGITLREQFYDLSGGKKPIIVSSLIELVYDQPRPTMWKRPDSQPVPPPINLAGEAQGTEQPVEPESLVEQVDKSRRTQPSDQDLAQYSLKFSKPYQPANTSEGSNSFDVLLAGNTLAEIDGIDPLQMLCTRSRDGRQIAMAKWSLFPGEGTHLLYRVDLREAQLSRHSLPEMGIHWIGFSPDGRTLAVSGVNEADGTDLFILVDLNNGTSRTLPIQASDKKIAWSPDGTRIAVLNEPVIMANSGIASRVNIYSAQDGEYLEQFETLKVPGSESFRVSLDGWEAEFPILLQDIESCAASPPD